MFRGWNCCGRMRKYHLFAGGESGGAYDGRSGERKQELQEKMEEQFGRYKNIQVELAGPSEQLPEGSNH
ncbi:MAG: hypothetical protein V8Q43_03890 [Christensenellaceae bacterium]